MSRWTEHRTGRKTTYEFEAVDRVRRDAAGIAKLSDETKPPIVNAAPVVIIVSLFFFLIGWKANMPGFFVLFVALAIVVLVTQVWTVVRKPAPERNDHARFVVALDPAMLRISWGEIEMTEELGGIERFEVAPGGIDLVRRDGSRQALPFMLEVDDAALALELGAAVERTLASGGYRGAEPEEEDEEQRARRRS